MENFNSDFNIPFYIFEEIVQYVELTSIGKCKSSKWSNIESLLRLAIKSNRLTKEQAMYLQKVYCKEHLSFI